eukprot:scaffold287197_cov32-Tisochrysis_lutea.AAC.2
MRANKDELYCADRGVLVDPSLGPSTPTSTPPPSSTALEVQGKSTIASGALRWTPPLRALRCDLRSQRTFQLELNADGTNGELALKHVERKPEEDQVKLDREELSSKGLHWERLCSILGGCGGRCRPRQWHRQDVARRVISLRVHLGPRTRVPLGSSLHVRLGPKGRRQPLKLEGTEGDSQRARRCVPFVLVPSRPLVICRDFVRRAGAVVLAEWRDAPPAVNCRARACFA